MSNFTDPTLYTYDRLNNFVTDYKQYINSLFQKAVTNDGGETYQYYHYETSPNAITATDIGRIPSTLIDASPSWTLQSNYNSTNGWKITLGTLYNKEIRPKQDQLLQSYRASGQIKNGLLFNAITMPSSPYFANASTFLKNSANFINIFSQDCSGLILANQQTALSMDNYSDAMNDPSNAMINQIHNNKFNTYAVEWYGYFYPSSPGNYSFSIKVDTKNSYFMLWIGDKAVCEYTGLNVDITNTTPSFTFVVTQNNYFPIRIQYFSQIGLETPVFTMNIQKTINTTGQSNVSMPIRTTECLFNIDGGNYFPNLQYCAFVSQSPDYFKQGKFQCYLLNFATSKPSDVNDFYTIIQQNKQSMQNGTFDKAGGVTAFGQLPDQTYYTPVTGDISSLPDMFSIYRLNTDFRMGNSYQIDTRMNNLNLYPMRQINEDLLDFAQDYDQLSGYYPNYTNAQGQSQNPFLNATNLDGEGCKASCNANPNCSFYYTYLSNGNPKCIIDNGSDVLQYNQVQPITGSSMPVDLNTSNLFMRNKELMDSGCNKDTDIQIKTLENVSVFNNSLFPFSMYDFSGTPVSKINDVGICGDQKYNDMNAEAVNILYHNAFYNRDGTFSQSMPKPNEPFTSREPMSNQGPNTKYTDAVNDTSDSIQANLHNQQQYGKMMQKMNQNYHQLEDTKIPEYLKTRTVLENNINYDFNGNTLLYLRNKRVPTAKEQYINDINESYTTQNLVYVLGTISAATLLVLAIMLARE